MLAQGGPEDRGDVVAPEVLVLDVDHPLRAGHRLGVATGDAPLPAAGEGVVATVAQVGIGAQQLDDVVPRLGRRRPLLGQWVGTGVQATQPVGQAPPRRPRERGRVVPAFAEDRLHVVDGRAPDRHLYVVPRRVVAVLLGERLRLRVATVVGVVAPVVGQVHPADEGDVAGRVVAVADHDELLVVGAAGAYAHVEQHLGAALLQLLAEVAVLGGEEAGQVQV